MINVIPVFQIWIGGSWVISFLNGFVLFDHSNNWYQSQLNQIQSQESRIIIWSKKFSKDIFFQFFNFIKVSLLDLIIYWLNSKWFLSKKSSRILSGILGEFQEFMKNFEILKNEKFFGIMKNCFRFKISK